MEISLQHVRLVSSFNTKNNTVDGRGLKPLVEGPGDNYNFFDPPFYSSEKLEEFGIWSSKQMNQYDHWLMLNSDGELNAHDYINIESPFGQICERGYSVSIIHIISAMDDALEDENTVIAAVDVLIRNMGGDSSCIRRNSSNKLQKCVIKSLRRSLLGLIDDLPKHCLSDRWWPVEADSNPGRSTCDYVGLDYLDTTIDTYNMCFITCKRFGRDVVLNKTDYLPCKNNFCCIRGECVEDNLCERRGELGTIGLNECKQKGSSGIDMGCKNLVNKHGLRFCNIQPFSHDCCIECARAGHSFNSHLGRIFFEYQIPNTAKSFKCYKCGEYPLHMRSSCLKNYQRQKPVNCLFACFLYSAYDVEMREWKFARGCSGPVETKFLTKCMYQRGIQSEIDKNLLVKCCVGDLCNNSTYFFLQDDQIWDNFKAKVCTFIFKLYKSTHVNTQSSTHYSHPGVYQHVHI